MSRYYADKTESLRAIVGADVTVSDDAVTAGGRRYPVLDDVIILTEPARWTGSVSRRLGAARAVPPGGAPFAEDIQFTFGSEWSLYDRVLPEHEAEFRRYFDLVDLASLKDSRVCDLGCGIGRWSRFLAGRCRELVLVDFSDAIFAARKNLSSERNALFFMGDILSLPFAGDFCDFLFCLGVLHHLPTPCLAEVRSLKRFSPRLLVFLYYALDNRPFYFRWALAAVTAARRILSRVRSPGFRRLFSKAGAVLLYKPLVALGRMLDLFGKGSLVPLYDFYKDRSLPRIEQDVYDRFFTRIEQRVTRRDIESLRDSFSEVTVSPDLPYWHFTANR